MHKLVPFPFFLVLCAALTVCAGLGHAGATVWDVSSVSELNSAVWDARSGDEIVIAPGDYYLTGSGLNMYYPGVTIRGATGAREDVVLYGSGMNTDGVREGIKINTDNITVRDLTLKDFYWNAIHIRAENDADNAVISNVKTWNIGRRHIKGSRDSDPNHVSDNTLIEGVYMLQTKRREPGNHHGDYIGGIDITGSSRGLTIRDCVAEKIVGYLDGGVAAIFLWQGVEDVLIERNTIINCAKGIGLGLTTNPKTDTIAYPWHATDIVVRNNFLLRGRWSTGNNIGLELCNLKGAQVYNNTFYSPNPTYFRTISVYDENAGAANTNVEMVNNIIRGQCWDYATGDWSNAAVAAMGNIVDTTGTLVTPGWFADVVHGDFHLTAAAAAAMDAATPLAMVAEDIDTGRRPASPDMGADEYQVPWPGDANQDGQVGIADLCALADNYGRVGLLYWAQGDFDRDGTVDMPDLSLLADHYGDTPGFGGVVPEPATVALLIAGAAALTRRRRRAPV